jgi:hypothetical protein
MTKDYELEFSRARLVAGAQLAGVVVIVVFCELVAAGVIQLAPEMGFPAEQAGTARLIFLVLAVAMLVAAVLLKWAIRDPKDGPTLSFLMFLIRQNRRRATASAMNLLVPPSALCEGAAIVGLLLFLLGGQQRADLYPLVTAAIAGLVLLFPNETDKQNLIRLDKAVPE